MEFPASADADVTSVLRALWSHAALSPEEDPAPEDDAWSTSGRARLRDGSIVPCWSYIAHPAQRIDVTFYVPLGALAEIWPSVGAYPFDDGSEVRPWQPALDDWLVEIATSVYSVHPFRFATVGWEVPKFSTQTYESLVAEGVPAKRAHGLLFPDSGGLLQWYPPTTG